MKLYEGYADSLFSAGPFGENGNSTKTPRKAEGIEANFLLSSWPAQWPAQKMYWDDNDNTITEICFQGKFWSANETMTEQQDIIVSMYYPRFVEYINVRLDEFAEDLNKLGVSVVVAYPVQMVLL